ncbi:right-handed parallel beta-helix repeat-containing protein [Mariniflexile sp. AS56]|uniref:right-handed parallel beta-helix repeat-containing protein n=1 Tax=Mariniflexile sp. AS56 TaxID=3063957 RepID=UPI0026E9B428|nr:right-handed parallel beta-helix repeat-containing protein [Mariniflexile sp. AS56]MDO7172490.1 right-handed parallel beta-helix repeat-containing protein [Mariniflexile sp. AS56]
MIIFIMLCGIVVNALEIYTSPSGGTNNKGTKEDPVSFETAIKRVSEQLKQSGLPDGGVIINVMGGLYRFDVPIVLGEEFTGTAQNPIIIRAVEGEKVLFDGSMLIPAKGFSKVKDKEERNRVPISAADNIVVTTITNKTMLKRFSENLMLNLSFNEVEYLPSVFPNEGYAFFKEETVASEVSPPGVPVGKEAHGVRAGAVPFLEPGRERGWKGSLEEPRGAQAGFSEKESEMAGTWYQWENEIKRNNKRNQLTGFIEANWLLSSQPIYSANGVTKSVHLSRALSYGWAWKKNDKPFRVFGLLCELDQPGEWHFDPMTNRLFLYPPEPINKKSKISLSVAEGFVHLKGASYVQIVGLSVKNVGGGTIYNIEGSHNLVASATISNSTANGVSIEGQFNNLEGCNLVDLNSHVSLAGGHRGPNEIVEGHNLVQNCHIYQKKYKHEKVNIGMSGAGNTFRNNLVHNSLGQAMVVNGNNQVIELNEFFNIGYDEGDGGAVYSGADLAGYGNEYRNNFFHHLMHSPGKVERSGIHLDDGQSGATCVGNIFYKSAGKGLFAFGGSGHTMTHNVFLEGYRGAYFVRSLGDKMQNIEKEIRVDKNHHRRGTKEDYVGRVEASIGENGWANSMWVEKYPTFNKVMSDTARFGRFWPIKYVVKNNYSYNNKITAIADPRVEPEALLKSEVEQYKEVEPNDFEDYDNLNLQFKNTQKFPNIPFNSIGLKKDKYRHSVPDKEHYRRGVKDFFEGISSMPGTKKIIDTSILVEE